MELLKSIGTVIYIELSYETLCERIGDLTKRGVSIRVGQTFRDLYEERKPLYEHYADITIHAEHLNIRELVHLMKKELSL